MKRHTYKIAIFMLAAVLLLSACGSATASPTPTPVDIGAISTAAVETFVAQLTENAPTITPTPVATNTPIATATSALPTNTLVPPTPASCANATFISDVTIPDGTVVAINTDFTKTWRVQNSGSCAWTTFFKLAFSYGEAMGGQPVAFTTAVNPGEQVDVSVKLRVPANKTGKLTGVWTLLDNNGQPFGKLLTVVVNVGTASPTPTATQTPVATATPTATPTP